MPEALPGLLRIRVVKMFNSGNAEVTNDLPHLHRTHIEVVAFQPGNSGNSAVGSFTIPLHPPGSDGYAAAKAIYTQLDYLQRVECYISHDGASLGKLYYAGIIKEIEVSHGQNPLFEIRGVSDVGLALLQTTFPGEVVYGGTSVGSFKERLGLNEAGWGDDFNVFNAGNYTSTNLPSLTSGTFAASTDDGLNVVGCSTGTGAALIAGTSATANDTDLKHYVEVVTRLSLTGGGSTTNAGIIGVGLSASSANANNSVVALVRTKYNSGSGFFDCDVLLNSYSGGVLTQTVASSALTSVNILDASSNPFVPLTIGLDIVANSGSFCDVQVTVNGKDVLGTSGQSFVVCTVTLGNTLFPLITYGTPASGSATGFFSNLQHFVRYAETAGHTGTAAFAPGTIGAATLQYPLNQSPGPTFLDIWSRSATMEGWYWRYTPQAYVVGTRTLGTVDLAADPGTDRGTNKQVLFDSAQGNLVELRLQGNSDALTSSTQLTGFSGNGGLGRAVYRNIATIAKYGAVEEQGIVGNAPSFNEQRKAARQINLNRAAINSVGAKTAIVLRDPQTADVWRELDKVMVNDPELGINYLVARVIGYTFDEGQSTQTLTLDQFTRDSPVLMKRFQTAVFEVSRNYSNR